MSGKSSPEFRWIDDEIQLLLEAMHNLKKIARGLTEKPNEINMMEYENLPLRIILKMMIEKSIRIMIFLKQS